MPKLTDQTELTSLADNDVAHVVDVSDTSSGAAGTSKRITYTNIFARFLATARTFASTITATGANLTGLTASQLVATDGSKNLQTLAVATYPSLTETSYVKGVTSAIQTQMDAKAPLASPTFTTTTSTTGSDSVVIQTLTGGGAGGAYNAVIADIGPTADATPTLIYTLTLATNATLAIRGLVRARRSGGGGYSGDSSAFSFFGCVKNISGTVSLVSTVDLDSKVNVAGMDVTFVPSGATLQFYVTGIAATNIQWSFFLETFGR